MLSKDISRFSSQEAFYGDVSRLEVLKANSAGEQKSTLKKAAQEFESLFISMALKSMRDSNRAFESGIFSDKSTEMFQDMYDQQLSLNLSQSGGLGLSDLLVEQLSSGSEEQMDVIQTAEISSPLFAKNVIHPHNALVPGKKTSASTTPLFQNPEEFVKRLLPEMIPAAQSIGLDPKLLVAQAALETGWGKALSSSQGGQSSHNLFGIKADPSWVGPKSVSLTTEVRDGLVKRENAAFRSYQDFKESIQDYLTFLKDNPRYQEALEKTAQPEQYMKALSEAGYATDPNYAQKVLTIYKKL